MAEKNTYNFEFYPDAPELDSVRVSFDIQEDLHCAKLHRMCKAFALALGYHSDTVEKYFGHDSFDDMD